MTNIQKLAAEGNKNHRIFAATVVDLMNSKDFTVGFTAPSTNWTTTDTNSILN